MKLYDKVLNTIVYTDTNEKHVGSQYQPSYDKPITTNSALITLTPLTDVEGLHRAYARYNGINI